MSFASDPELPKNTFDIGTGDISINFCASRIGASDDIDANAW